MEKSLGKGRRASYENGWINRSSRCGSQGENDGKVAAHWDGVEKKTLGKQLTRVPKMNVTGKRGQRGFTKGGVCQNFFKKGGHLTNGKSPEQKKGC